MIEEIKDLYSQLIQKAEFVRMAGQKFNKSPGTIRNHWIYGDSMPATHQKDFKKLLERVINKQKQLMNILK